MSTSIGPIQCQPNEAGEEAMPSTSMRLSEWARAVHDSGNESD